LKLFVKLFVKKSDEGAIKNILINNFNVNSELLSKRFSMTIYQGVLPMKKGFSLKHERVAIKVSTELTRLMLNYAGIKGTRMYGNAGVVPNKVNPCDYKIMLRAQKGGRSFENIPEIKELRLNAVKNEIIPREYNKRHSSLGYNAHGIWRYQPHISIIEKGHNLGKIPCDSCFSKELFCFHNEASLFRELVNPFIEFDWLRIFINE
jgi:hypothetical protein